MKIHDIVQENSLWQKFKTGISDLIRGVVHVIFKIDFGQHLTFRLRDFLKVEQLKEVDLETASKRDRFDLTSMIGYLNEYMVASKLSIILEGSGINVTTNVAEGLVVYAENYKRYILDNVDKFEKPQSVAREVSRADQGSNVMAKKIFSEISGAHDLKFIDVRIDLTGQSRGQEVSGKEDIKITIRKRGTKKVVEMIKASLKLYKTPSGINVYNSTFASYLVTVVTGNENAGIGDKAIAAFLKDNPQYTDDIERVLAITKQWTKIKTELKKQGSKDYRKAANKFITDNRGYQQMRDLLFKKIFDYFYATDKIAINERVLDRLGLAGADDVYLLVGTTEQKMVAVSSRTSEEFKRLYENLKRGFNLRYDIPDNPDVVACSLVIDSEEGEELARFTISFKEGATFPHMWNMKQIVDDAKKSSR